MQLPRSFAYRPRKGSREVQGQARQRHAKMRGGLGRPRHAAATGQRDAGTTAVRAAVGPSDCEGKEEKDGGGLSSLARRSWKSACAQDCTAIKSDGAVAKRKQADQGSGPKKAREARSKKGGVIVAMMMGAIMACKGSGKGKEGQRHGDGDSHDDIVGVGRGEAKMPGPYTEGGATGSGSGLRQIGNSNWKKQERKREGKGSNGRTPRCAIVARREAGGTGSAEAGEA